MKKIILILSLSIFTFFTKAQNNTIFQANIAQIDTFIARKNINAAAQLLEKTIVDFPEKKLSKSEQLILQTQVGNFYLDNVENEALSFTAWKKAILLAAELYPNDFKAKFKPIDAYLYAMSQTGYYNDLIYFVEKNIKEWERVLPSNSLEISKVYNRYGITQSNIGNHEKGDIFIKRAIEIAESSEDIKALSMIARFRYGLGFSFYNRKMYQEAVIEYEKSIELINQNNLIWTGFAAQTYACLGEAYTDLKMEEKALPAKLKALEIYEKVYSPDDENLLYMWNALGVSYILNGNFEKAIFYYEKALKADPKLTYALASMAKIYLQKGDFEKANEYLNQDFAVFGYSENCDFSKTTAPQRMSVHLMRKVQILEAQYKATSDFSFMENALKTMSEVKRLALYNINHFDEKENKNAYYDDAIQSQNKTIELDYQAFTETADTKYLENAFEEAEFSKSLLTYQSLAENTKSVAANVPELLKKTAKTEQENVTNLEKEIFEKGANEQLKAQLFEAKKTYGFTKTKIQTVCKNYFETGMKTPSNSLATAQNLLDNETTMLEYVVSDDAIFIFIVQKNDLKCLRLEKDFALEKTLSELYENMKKSPSITSDYAKAANDFCEKSNFLYQKLIAPIAVSLKKNVIIVPDAVLNQLPFEVLLIEKAVKSERFQQHHYWLEKQNISYAISANMLKLMQKNKNKANFKENFLGIAPFYDNSSVFLDSIKLLADVSRGGLRALPFSGEEVYRSAKLMNGKTLVGAAAAQENVLQELKKYRILHFATHGKANLTQGGFSYLAFSPQGKQLRMYARDISNLELQTELVVLSACESGTGEIQRGEGVVGLSKAFVQSGAQNLITTLWAINDEKTKDLMVYFYTFLQQGKTKSEALQQAKLKYLREQKGSAAHPFYWAAFLEMGL